MSLDSPHPLFIVVVTIVAIIVLMWTGEDLGAQASDGLVRAKGHDLVSFRGAWFYEGPRARLRTEEEDAYHVEVRDRHGETRMGYVVFGSDTHSAERSRLNGTVEVCHSALNVSVPIVRAAVARHDHDESRACREANCASRRVGGMMSPSKSGPRAMLPIHEQSRCQRPSDMAAFLQPLSGGYADMRVAAADRSQALFDTRKRCDRRDLQ